MSTTASNPPQPSNPRPRPQARKKPNDDAAYTGPSAAALAAGGTQSAKRQASDRAEGEPRNKRKKAELAANGQNNKTTVDQMSESRSSLVEFNKLSTAELHRYLTQFNIVPTVRPSPLLVDDPPAPLTLANPARVLVRENSPGVTTTANRPRREVRRRSSRVGDEENGRSAVLSDVKEVHAVLAGIAERHFRETLTISGREEVDTLASFMCAVEKAKAVRVRTL
ncbi:hypothetical protein AX15_001145 [Amanita polypyramis BW_CC]|nr:hypothetical protein AX15_001145 [Amanita polypyramis BW_CC]